MQQLWRLGTCLTIEYDVTQQAANKLAGLCPFCESDKDYVNLHNIDCPKLQLMAQMTAWGEWEGDWPSWGDDLVRNNLDNQKPTSQ